MSKDGTNNAERTDAVLSILPSHDAPRKENGQTYAVKRGRGRPRKVDRMPTTTDLQYHAAMADAREKFIASDGVLSAISNNADPMAILYNIKKEVAREAASLHFERLETEKRGRDTSMISSRRIEALKKIAEIELKVRELDDQAINFSNERFQKVFALWVEVMREVASEVMPEEVYKLFFNKFATAMEGWEERASNALR